MIVALVVAFTVLLASWAAWKPIMGLVAPIGHTAPRYLRQELTANGVDVSRLPPACLYELAAEIVRVSKLVSSTLNRSWRAHVIDDLGHTALILAIRLGECKPPPGLETGWDTEAIPKYVAILRKHGVSIPSL